MQHIAQAAPQRKQSSHQVAQINYIGVDFGWTDIDVFVDISDQLNNRIKPEALYETQGRTFELARKRIEAFAGYAGWWSRTGCAETFIRAKVQNADYLTDTSNDLKIAGLTGNESHAILSQFASSQSAGANS